MDAAMTTSPRSGITSRAQNTATSRARRCQAKLQAVDECERSVPNHARTGSIEIRFTTTSRESEFANPDERAKTGLFSSNLVHSRISPWRPTRDVKGARGMQARIEGMRDACCGSVAHVRERNANVDGIGSSGSVELMRSRGENAEAAAPLPREANVVFPQGEDRP